MIGTVGAELDLTGLVREMSRRLARNLTVDSDPRSARVGERFLAEAKRHLAESVALLERLSQRYAVGIVSNFYGNLGAVCAEVGLDRHVGVLVDSTLAGCLKPDPRIFQAALDALGVTAGQAVFVGDSRPRDMAGARGMGMPHILLAPGGGETCCPGDLRIDSLGELTHKFL
jgi:HAD superfamily hydrolase (TIGR01509 family)